MEQFLFMYGGAMLKGFFVTLFFLASILFCERFLHSYKKASHHTPSPLSRLGGIALIAGFLLALWTSAIPVFPLAWWVFSGVLLLIVVVGVWDDVRGLHWSYQLVAQVGILTLLYLGGVRILTLTNPAGGFFDLTSGSWAILGFCIFLVWGILVLNSINWLDGVDGLAGSVLLVTYGILFVLALSPAVYQPAIAILLAIAFGGTLAFLVYNFPPAKIISGTSGSLFFGVVIVFVSVVAGTKIATTLLVLALPIADTAFVLGKRLFQKRSLFQPDYGHLHHILQREGWSNRSIVSTYAFLTLLIGIIALSTETLGKLTALILIFSILGGILTFFHFKNTFPRKWFLVAGVALLIVSFLFGSSYARTKEDTAHALIGGHWYALEVADSPVKRQQGLSGKENLCFHCGMLFEFPKAETPLFWMKDMRFSIDVLWLADDTVVAKHENLPFPSLQTFGPGEPVTKVIELPAGSAKDIQIGAKIYFW